VIKKVLNSFQFDIKKLKTITICNSCIKDNRFNILSKKEQIKSADGSIICADCALKVVTNQIELLGLFKTIKISPKLKNFFRHMVLKFRDIEKVIKVFKLEFDPSKNRDITLYDIERNPVIDKKYLNYDIRDLKIPEKLKQLMFRFNIRTLLPIQAISIDKGLLEIRSNQLIMAPTSAGKTLVGEIAGITRILNDHLKMLYLVPIVALANVRTDEFESKYRDLDLKIIKKVGESILDTTEPQDLEELIDADIIVATYEAIDYILRSGKQPFIRNLGTIIIDEIQTLTDPERGFILDGLIARLKMINEQAQFLYLSATIGQPKILATKLDCKLINFNNRPVPIERHLVVCLSEEIKFQYLKKLVKSAFLEQSNYGFKGQSIIFTNSRKKCETISEFLRNKAILAEAYHSGLTNDERKEIEIKFQNQVISVVVATAALAAGVDFPAKQVIFESLLMGINILTVAEFEQMLGRAGRLGKHDVGYAYILVEPGKTYNQKSKITEENIAINLLNGKIKDFELEPNEDRSMTELLAVISTFVEGLTLENIFRYNKLLINSEYDLNKFIEKLIKLNLVYVDVNKNYYATNLGKAISKSFLTIDQSLEIINRIRLKQSKISEIVLELKPLKNVYLSKKVVKDLAKYQNMKYFSNNFFSASILSLMDANYVRKRKKFSREFIDYIIKWTSKLFTCDCKDKPYCNCGRINLENIILKLRVEDNFSIEQISYYLEEEYKILIYKGDLTDYLENLIYSFESIYNISKGISNLNYENKKEVLEIPFLIEKIKK
ncbi:MAG: DEAD/DEAH box helicase, partial [Candidatus Thorarchaeota archaeon]